MMRPASLRASESWRWYCCRICSASPRARSASSMLLRIFSARARRRAGHAGGLGLAGLGGDGVAHDDADADPGPDGGTAVDDPPPDGGEPGLELTGVLGCE